MGPLTSSDAAKIIESLHGIYRETNLRALPKTAVGVLANLVPSDAAAFNVIHADHRVEIMHNAPWLEKEVARRTWALEKYIDQHPLENFFKKTARSEPVRVSDFLSRTKFHDLALYQEFYQPLGVEYQISIFLRQIDEFRIGLGVQRQQKDFTERDKTVIAQIAPHIFQAYKNARKFTEARDGVNQLQKALGMHRQGFVHLSRKGKVKSMTSWCAQWLSTYCADYRRKSSDLPESVKRWLDQQLQAAAETQNVRRPLILRRRETRLVIRMAEERDGVVLLLTEQTLSTSPEDLQPLGLRKRETEVLFWMAQGKSDPEIAIILGTSPRTINKHAEHIFRSLGVESRHGATLAALELLGSNQNLR